MLKIAASTNNVATISELKTLLVKYYNCTIDESRQGGLHIAVFTIAQTEQEQIAETLKFIETKTRVSLQQRVYSKRRSVVRARRVACYLLRYRFGLSNTAAAHMLGYKTHASVLLLLHGIGKINVKRPIPLDLVVNRVLEIIKQFESTQHHGHSKKETK